MSRIPMESDDLYSRGQQPAIIRIRDSVIGLSILLTWVVAGPYSIMTILGGPIPQWLTIGGFLIAPTLFLVLYPLWTARRRGAELLKWPGATPAVREAAIGIGCGIATVLILGGIELAIFGKVFELPEPLHQLVVAKNSLIPMITFALAPTVIPLGEELFYRGLISGSLRRWSIPGALVIQSFLFSLFHQYDLVYSIFVFIAGVLFGIVYELRRTLWAPIFMHVTCNLFTVIMLAIAFVNFGNSPVLGIATEMHKVGCRITKVVPNSSADQAGLQVGDIVIRVADQPTPRPRDLLAAMEQFELGDKVKVEIKRGGKQMAVTATLNQRRR